MKAKKGNSPAPKAKSFGSKTAYGQMSKTKKMG